MAERKCSVGILKLLALIPLLLILVGSVEYFVVLQLHTKISTVVKSTWLMESNIVTEEIPKYAHVVDDDPARPRRTLSPFEEYGGNIVLTIRTTVSLHKKRLPLLMETWLTVANCSHIYLVTDGRDPEVEANAAKLGG